MRKRTVPRILLVSLIVASLPAVPFARAESVFDARGGSWDDRSGAPSFRGAGAQAESAMLYRASAQDTMEIIDIEFDEEAEGRSIYKEVAVVALVAAAVGYVVYLFIGSDSEETPVDEGSGKPTPFTVVPYSSTPFIRGR
jgi:hypothetical protein